MLSSFSFGHVWSQAPGAPGLLEAEIVLWQEFDYHHKTRNFNDVLCMAVGEKIGVHLPGAMNVPFNNKAPILYSALQTIFPLRWAETHEKKVMAMNERFTVRYCEQSIAQGSESMQLPTLCILLRFVYFG